MSKVSARRKRFAVGPLRGVAMGLLERSPWMAVITAVTFVGACRNDHDARDDDYGLPREGVTSAIGELDPSFDIDGIVTTPVGPNMGGEMAGGVVIQPDGRIVAITCSGSNFIVVRHHTDGALDTTFGAGGIVTTDIGTPSATATCVAIQSDGKVVVGGFSEGLDGGDPVYGNDFVDSGDFVVVRYSADGSLDTTFDVDGIVITDIEVSDFAFGVALQPDGKIVVVGQTDNVSAYLFALVRYNADGSLDTTFDSDGKVTTSISPDSGNDIPRGVAIQPDGRIVVVGRSGTYSAFAVVRYRADGSLDTSFDTDGIVTTAIGNSAAAHGVAVQPDGKIVVVGSRSDAAGYDFAATRYNTDGSLDVSFGVDGIVATAIGSLYSIQTAYGLAIQSDGKIVAAGTSSSSGYGGDFAVLRYNADGSLDTSFGTDGVVMTDTGGSYDFAYGVAIQSDGKIVTAGFSGTGFPYDVAVVRYR